MIKVSSLNDFQSSKIVPIDKASKIITEKKDAGFKVGLCHGGFDMLHPGHMKHFESAKMLCDILFVSITSDRFVNKRKKTGRPIVQEQLRAYSIASLGSVDFVLISDFNLGVEVIECLRPDYYIKGPDYMDKDDKEINAEKEAVDKAGGRIRFTQDIKLSTSSIIDYIKKEL